MLKIARERMNNYFNDSTNRVRREVVQKRLRKEKKEEEKERITVESEMKRLQKIRDRERIAQIEADILLNKAIPQKLSDEKYKYKDPDPIKKIVIPTEEDEEAKGTFYKEMKKKQNSVKPEPSNEINVVDYIREHRLKSNRNDGSVK